MCQVDTLSPKQGADLPSDRNYETFQLPPSGDDSLVAGQESLEVCWLGTLITSLFIPRTVS